MGAGRGKGWEGGINVLILILSASISKHVFLPLFSQAIPMWGTSNVEVWFEVCVTRFEVLKEAQL